MSSDSADATLRSDREQTIELQFGLPLRFANAADAADRDRVKKIAKGRWTVDLPAGRTMKLACRR